MAPAIDSVELTTAYHGKEEKNKMPELIVLLIAFFLFSNTGIFTALANYFIENVIFCLGVLTILLVLIF